MDLISSNKESKFKSLHIEQVNNLFLWYKKIALIHPSAQIITYSFPIRHSDRTTSLSPNMTRLNQYLQEKKIHQNHPKLHW
jgi:hypothetical protein